MSKSLCVIEALESRHLLNAGQLDKSFGDAGKVSLPADATITRLFQLSDGRILVAGTQNNSPFVERLLPRGQADPTYQQTGIASLKKYGVGVEAYGLDNADRLLVAESTSNPNAIRIFRLTTRGTIDKTFGNKGKLGVPLETITGFLFLPDGKILVTGSQPTIEDDETENTSTQTVVLVFLSNGQIDKSFNRNGIALANTVIFTQDNEVSQFFESSVGGEAVFPLPSRSFLYLQEIESFNSVELSEGESMDESASNFYAFAFTSDGSMDSSFVFDRTNVLPRHIRDGGFQNEMNGTFQGAVQLPDGSIRFVQQIEEFDDDSDESHFDTFLDTMTPDGTISVVPLPKGITATDFVALFEADGEILFQSNGSSLFRLNPVTGKKETVAINTTDTGDFPFSFPLSNLSDDGQILAISKNQSLIKLQDSDSPTGTLQAQPLRTSKSTSHRFQITWQDDKSVAWKTLGNGDVSVDFPDGSEHAAKLISVNKHHNSGLITATYAVAPPNGLWDSTANGAYTISVRANHVWDTEGNAAEGRELGQFNIQIPPPAATPTASIAIHLKKNAIRNDVLD